MQSVMTVNSATIEVTLYQKSMKPLFYGFLIIRDNQVRDVTPRSHVKSFDIPANIAFNGLVPWVQFSTTDMPDFQSA